MAFKMPLTTWRSIFWQGRKDEGGVDVTAYGKLGTKMKYCAINLPCCRRSLAVRVPKLSAPGHPFAGATVRTRAPRVAARVRSGSHLPPPSPLIRLSPPTMRCSIWRLALTSEQQMGGHFLSCPTRSSVARIWEYRMNPAAGSTRRERANRLFGSKTVKKRFFSTGLSLTFQHNDV